MLEINQRQEELVAEVVLEVQDQLLLTQHTVDLVVLEHHHKLQVQTLHILLVEKQVINQEQTQQLQLT